MRSRPVKIPEEMDEDIQRYMKMLGYASFSEFARTAIREKIYGVEISREFEKKIEKGLEDLKEGRTISHEEVKSKIGGKE